MVKKTKETRTSTIIKEFEDKNTHTIDNSVDPDGNVVGVYRWVDKIYKASLVNYGRRMMIKFNLVEPSAYYQWTQMNNPSAEVDFPIAPDQVAKNVTVIDDLGNDIIVKLNSFKDINENNYDLWAKEYGARVERPPTEYLNVGDTIISAINEAKEWQVVGVPLEEYRSDKIKDFRLPEGYEMRKIYVRPFFERDWNKHKEHAAKFDLFIGNHRFEFNEHPEGDGHHIKVQSTTTTIGTAADIAEFNEKRKYISPSGGSIPIVWRAKNCHQLQCNFVVKCKRTRIVYENWQKET